MRRALLAVVAVGASVFSVFLVVGGGTVAQQTSWLVNDAGITAVTHAATCPVRISDACLAMAADAGVVLHKDDRLRFPVAVRGTAPNFDVQLPPMDVGLAGMCIEVISWADCTLDATPAAVTAVAPLLGQQLPFTPLGVVKPWCRAKFDAGLPCLLLDGGSFGDRNVSACALRADPATCERVGTGVIFAGDDPEAL